MGYSFEQKKKAVELYVKYGKSVAAMRNELGYPSRQALYNWSAAGVDPFSRIVFIHLLMVDFPKS